MWVSPKWHCRVTKVYHKEFNVVGSSIVSITELYGEGDDAPGSYRLIVEAIYVKIIVLQLLL